MWFLRLIWVKTESLISDEHQKHPKKLSIKDYQKIKWTRRVIWGDKQSSYYP